MTPIPTILADRKKGKIVRFRLNGLQSTCKEKLMMFSYRHLQIYRNFNVYKFDTHILMETIKNYCRNVDH